MADEKLCPACRGSGEGQCGESLCLCCNGRGTIDLDAIRAPEDKADFYEDERDAER